MADAKPKNRLMSLLRAGVSVSCISLLGILSCSGDGPNCPEGPQLPSGRAVIDTAEREDESGHYYLEGFSFSEGAVVRVPNQQGIKADFIMMYLTGTEGKFAGILLRQPYLQPAFLNVATVGTLEEGQSAFDSMTLVPEGACLQAVAGQAWPYSVWVVGTNDGKFGKIFIDRLSFGAVEDSCGVHDYGEITFDWQYQPNGSRGFR
jgi:hypothetical protein